MKVIIAGERLDEDLHVLAAVQVVVVAEAEPSRGQSTTIQCAYYI